jgi:hypothetical protein
LRALQAVQSGPGWYDRLLMMVRRLIATTTARRRHLLHTQGGEFHRDYILRYGLWLARYYFICDTLAEVPKSLGEASLPGHCGHAYASFGATGERPELTGPCPSFF